MNGGDPPPETLICGRCAAVCDGSDNFCRQCGMSLQDQNLPSVRNGHSLPVAWRPSLPPAVVRGAAVVAAGTIAELLFKRAVRGVLSGKPREEVPPDRAVQRSAVPADPSRDDAQIVSETFWFRRVRIRR